MRGVTTSALCAVAGHIVWWLLLFFWRGESVPYFIREPGAATALVVGFVVAGYLQAIREWARNERELIAAVESENNTRGVV